MGSSMINEDLTTIEVSPFLKQCVGKGKEIPAGSILQIQQVTNISFPTTDKPNYNSESHTLKLTLTDGQSQGYALVPDGCPGISTNTPPGTKIKIAQTIPVNNSLFVLNRNNCEVLGGRVTKLYERWEIQKKMDIKHDWGYTGSAVEGEGPPPWRPFGYKSAIDVGALRRMKTTDVANEKRDGKGGEAKTEFDMRRDEAVSELQAVATKQKFQKPNKHLLDKEITDIMDEGFSQSDAEYAMGRFKNAQKAIKFLKDSKKHKEGGANEPPPKPAFERKDRRRKGKGNRDDDEEQEVPREFKAPAANTSLFAFIEGQIKSDDKSATGQKNGSSKDNYGSGTGRNHDLEDRFGRLSTKDSRGGGGDSYYGRSERGGRGGRGSSYRGGASSTRGDHHQPQRDSYYQSQQPRGDRGGAMECRKEDPTSRAPRFQNRTGSEYNDSKYSDYNHSASRNHSSGGRGGGGNYDSYRGSNNYESQSRSNYGANSQTSSSGGSTRHEYNSGYQTHPQQRQQSSGKDRSSSYASDYPPPYTQQQQYSKSNEYSVPSSQQSYHHSYPPPQQHNQSSGAGGGRQQQYTNNNSQNTYENMGSHQRSRGGGQQQRQVPSHYSSSNHSGGGHGGQPSHSEFGHYQYGYDEWNPQQSLVFTRSKAEGGRTRGVGGSRGAPSSYNRGGNSRY